MGKRSSKSHANRKLGSPEKNLFSYLRGSFTAEESNDSGLGSDTSILFADSNVTVCAGPESDLLDNSCDSSVNFNLKRRSSDDFSSFTTAPMPTNYGRGQPLRIKDANFVNSLSGNNMHIHGMDSTNRPRVTSVFSLTEPLAKRRKMMSDDYVDRFTSSSSCSSSSSSFMTSSSRENGFSSFSNKPPSNSSRSSQHIIGSGVLTEAAVCQNALSKRDHDSLNCQVSSVDEQHHDHRLPWSSRENFGHLHKNSNGDDGGGGGGGSKEGCDRIAALLSVATQPLLGSAGRKKLLKKPSLHVCFPSRSKELKAELTILIQPEEQHRARYMTEGSRGSIKDLNGNGFPKIKLCGLKQPVVLQVFIGSDSGKIQPHLFYQACKVTGKNCTPCTERMIEGTSVIEINLTPENDMTVSCDCIGILKERNVDVEQRLPYFGLARCKKRSTKCRMVFRVNVSLPNGNIETLQIASSQILCTQSPGVPEICKKSLTECSVKGGTELFIIGKNFQKDTKILFQELRDGDDNVGVCERKLVWEEMVDPEKEFLHQSHLICSVPPYRDGGIMFPTKVYLSVLSGGKSSEPHTFTYTPCRSVSSGNNYSGCDSQFHLRSPHESMGFCKSEMLSPELTSPVICSSPVRQTNMLNSQQTMMPGSCPTSPIESMPGAIATHVISQSQSTTPQASPNSSASSSHQFPMFINSDGEQHNPLLQQHQEQQQQQQEEQLQQQQEQLQQQQEQLQQQQEQLQQQHEQLQQQQEQQQQSLVRDNCTSVLIAIADTSEASAMLAMTTTSFPSGKSISVPQHSTTSNADLAGHDVDLMKKIDQLACEMTAVEEACCVAPRSVPKLNLPISIQSSPTATTQEAIASSEVLHNCQPIFSDGTSMQCHQVGYQQAISTNPIGTSVSLASIVSAMVTSANTPGTMSDAYALNQTAGTSLPQTASSHQQNEVSTMSTISNIHQLDSNQSNNMMVDVKPLMQSQLDNLQACPQPLQLASQSSDPGRALQSMQDESISFDVHCCSDISPSIASCISTSTTLNGKVLSHRMNNQGPSTSNMPEVKPTNASSTFSSSSEQNVTKTDKAGTQPDMMTLAFSQLSDADLLSMINPSTFDSV